MKIAYKKKHYNIHLFFGILWFLFCLISFYFSDMYNWTNYGYLVTSILYLTFYFYQKNGKYLTITNNILKVNNPFGKKVSLKEVKFIQIFAGDYIVKTDKYDLRINTEIINPNCLIALQKELEKLNVRWV